MRNLDYTLRAALVAAAIAFAFGYWVALPNCSPWSSHLGSGAIIWNCGGVLTEVQATDPDMSIFTCTCPTEAR